MDENELKQVHAELALTIEHTIAIVATALARQVDAYLLVNNIRGLQKRWAKDLPNAVRDRWLDTACSLIETLGVPIPKDKH